MKQIGTIRNLDNMGRIVIPKPIRNSFSLDKNTPLHIFIDEDCIVLKKYETGCCFCGEMSNTVAYNDSIICGNCITALYQSYSEIR